MLFYTKIRYALAIIFVKIGFYLWFCFRDCIIIIILQTDSKPGVAGYNNHYRIRDWSNNHSFKSYQLSCFMDGKKKTCDRRAQMDLNCKYFIFNHPLHLYILPE